MAHFYGLVEGETRSKVKLAEQRDLLADRLTDIGLTLCRQVVTRHDAKLLVIGIVFRNKPWEMQGVYFRRSEQQQETRLNQIRHFFT